MEVLPSIQIFKDANSLAEGAAGKIIARMNEALREHGVCAVALSGGDTPRSVYRFLASDQLKGQVDWTKVHLFFGDERLVPPDDPRSNFGMVRQELLARVPIPADNIRRVRGELPPVEAAQEYRDQLRSFFKEGTPRFDLILLGLGEDGHTASLFPGSDAMDETREPVAVVFAPGSKEQRVTLTLLVINNALEVLFLVSGRKKASIVRDVLTTNNPVRYLPAKMVHPIHGTLHWMIDADAASQIVHGVQPLSSTPLRRWDE